MYQIPDFLENRQAAWRGIKSLELTIGEYFDDEEAGEFESWCDAISRTLVLDTVRLLFVIEEENLEKLLAADRPYNNLAASRKLHVVESFEINLVILVEEDEDDEKSDELERKHTPTITSFMLPDTLRTSWSKVYHQLQPLQRPS